MRINPEQFHKLVEAFLKKDTALNGIIGLANVMGDAAVVNSVNNLAIAAALPQIINPDPFVPHPSDADFQGNFYLGTGIDFTPRISVDMLIKHYLCSGSSGAGKTTQAFYFMHQFTQPEINKKFLHIGFKQNTRHFSDYIPILVLTTGPEANFLWRILDAPPGVSQTVWDNAVVKLFCESQYIAEAGQSLMLSCLSWLRKNTQQVDFFSLYKQIKTLKVRAVRELNWKATLVNRLGAFLATCSRMLKAPYSLPLEDLLKNFNIELELDRAGEFKSFLGSVFLTYLYLHRISNNIRSSSLITPVLCDELNCLVNKTMERHALYELMILQLIRLGREFGIGFILFTNEVTAVPNTVKAQSSIKAIMHTANWLDIEDIGRSMNLTQEQMEVCQDLPVGNAIIKRPGLQSFLTVFPLITIKKCMTDQEIAENNKCLLKDTEFEFILLTHEDMPIQVSKELEEEKKQEAEEGEEREENKELQVELQADDKTFLIDIYNRPFISITERFESLELTAGKGSRLINRLLNTGLIEKIEINLGGRGGSTKFLALTKKGFELIELPIKQGFSRGGGFEHTFWQFAIAKHLRKITDSKVSMEKNLKGKFIDIVVELQDKLIAIEIQIDASHTKENIEKDIASGCNLVLIGCKDKKVQKQVKAIIESLKEDIKNKVKVYLLPELLKIESLS